MGKRNKMSTLALNLFACTVLYFVLFTFVFVDFLKVGLLILSIIFILAAFLFTFMIVKRFGFILVSISLIVGIYCATIVAPRVNGAYLIYWNLAKIEITSKDQLPQHHGDMVSWSHYSDGWYGTVIFYFLMKIDENNTQPIIELMRINSKYNHNFKGKCKVKVFRISSEYVYITQYC